jgi:hypothetical protein
LPDHSRVVSILAASLPLSQPTVDIPSPPYSCRAFYDRAKKKASLRNQGYLLLTGYDLPYAPREPFYNLGRANNNLAVCS